MSYERPMGSEVYAASAIGSKIMPGWNVQRITPEGERGPLMPTPRRFAAPIGNGPVRPYKTLFGRAIGPQGPTGPVTALGDNGDRPFTQLVMGAVIVGLGFFVLFRPLRKERNPKRKLLGMSPKGERLFGELNPEDIRYMHVYAVKDGRERYVGQVLDTGGAYFAVLPSGRQVHAHTAKEAAEVLVGIGV